MPAVVLDRAGNQPDSNVYGIIMFQYEPSFDAVSRWEERERGE